MLSLKIRHCGIKGREELQELEEDWKSLLAEEAISILC